MKTGKLRSVLWAVIGSTAFACSPSRTTPPEQRSALDQAGANPVLASRPAEESSGGEESEEHVGLRARVERGLAISPVPLHTEGLTHKQKMQVGLGSYIVNGTAVCTACHSGPSGFLSGGTPFFLDKAGHVVWSRNLTPDASTGLKLTEAQFIESFRTGRDFHAGETRFLVVMPWPTLRWMSDEDLKAVYAYVRAIPPVHNAVPPDKKDLPLPTAVPFPGFYNDGEIDRPLPSNQASFSARRGLAIAPRANPADLEDEELRSYAVGSYIANSMSSCNDCHTNPDRTSDFRKINTAAYLSGGDVFNVPPPRRPLLKQVRTMSANLKGASHGFFYEPTDSYARFRQIILTGTHADEKPSRPLGFPMTFVSANLRHVLEEDLRAVYDYVKGVPAIVGANDQPRQDYARYCTQTSDCHAGESCSTATHECVGKACAADVECDACQTCSSSVCIAPAPDSACVASGR